MSTRCQIAFYWRDDQPVDKWDALIYRHRDGYPEGVLPDVTPFLEWWVGERGLGEPEYSAARLLQYLCNQDDSETVQNNKMCSIETPVAPTGTIGYGVSSAIHGDIEYFYRIHPNEILVYKVRGTLPTDEREPDQTIPITVA